MLTATAQTVKSRADRQVWLWRASGTVLGAGIMTLFAIFEQRRNDVLRMIEEIKKWD